MNISRKKLIIITLIIAAIGIPTTILFCNKGKVGSAIMCFTLIWVFIIRLASDDKKK